MDSWVIILTSAAFGGIVSELVRLIQSIRTGKSEEKRLKNADLVAQRDHAFTMADRERERAAREQERGDREARNRNRAQDHVAQLRRLAIESGIPITDLPQAPTYER